MGWFERIRWMFYGMVLTVIAICVWWACMLMGAGGR